MIRAKIDEKLELRFRELAMRRFGYSKGSLSRAIEEAILRWVAFVEDLASGSDPIDAIDGVLSDIDMDSVELQHIIRDVWASKVLDNVPDRH